MDLETIQQLFAYNAWANQRTIAGCESISNEQFLQQVGGSFGSVRNTLAHIMDVEWLYHERWNGRAPSAFPNAAHYGDLSQIKARWKTVDADVNYFVEALSADEISQVIEFRNIKGVVLTHPLWETMQHMVNHSTYHRGQVTTLLRQLGGTAQASDMLLFFRERSAQAAS
jgi:uncharacterized damage-inducible protein DinB